VSRAALNVAIQAARKAGSLILQYRRQMESIPVEKKARHDYVTEVDRQAERTIIAEIRRHHPDHAFLGEEEGRKGDGDYLWIIDPLDGTSNYLHGIPHYAVSIALAVKGQLEVGVIYDPIRDELYTAMRGEGAFLNSVRIRVSQRLGLDGALLATGFPFRKRRLIEPYFGMFRDLFDQVEDIRRAGTASLDLAWVAAGRLDGFWELGLKPWDVAAGGLLVGEAGGVVQDITGGDGWLKTGHIVAAPFKLVAGMRRAIDPHVTAGLGNRK